MHRTASLIILFPDIRGAKPLIYSLFLAHLQPNDIDLRQRTRRLLGAFLQ
jgi:hypothetical protein